MFGQPHDIDKSFSSEEESNTRDVAALEIELENALEDAKASRTLSLRPLVLEYEKDILEFLEDLKKSNTNSLLNRTIIHSYAADEMEVLLTKLLKGAHEVL